MVFITNFNNSKDSDELLDYYNEYGETNINFLFNDFSNGAGKWTVAKNAVIGDVIVFMCAKEARHNLGTAAAHLTDDYGEDFISFVNIQKALYKKYSGFILGYGIIASTPQLDGKRLMSDINPIFQFDCPIYIDEFKSFISINKFSSVTYIDDEQWERLKWIINEKNPGTFTGVNPPEAAILEKEFEESVRSALKKTLAQLKKAAENIKPVSASTAQTKIYHRNPDVAAYVKARAKGLCQLCGNKAPFLDSNNEPYLENHHIVWLSRGGEDSAGNCAALCPNCHRRMHIIDDPNDIQQLKDIVSNNP